MKKRRRTARGSGAGPAISGAGEGGGDTVRKSALDQGGEGCLMGDLMQPLSFGHLMSWALEELRLDGPLFGGKENQFRHPEPGRLITDSFGDRAQGARTGSPSLRRSNRPDEAPPAPSSSGGRR